VWAVGRLRKRPIPAGAGETIRAMQRRWLMRAYPRGRGGNSLSCHDRQAPRGLSPRARGKLRYLSGTYILPGPIPAGAGETVNPITFWYPTGAYPRGRGGNAQCRACDLAPRGLSPRARGKLAAIPSTLPYTGPIPAGAGETACARSASQAHRAYPRGRGGNQAPRRQRWWRQGLSPRARGKPTSIKTHRRCFGPIPAGAGETAAH